MFLKTIFGIGLEHLDDIKDDLTQALDKVSV